MHQETLQFLVKYRNHQLDAQADAAVEVHLQSCPPCRLFLKDFDVILASYDKLEKDKARTMIADYLIARMPAELVKRLDHLEQVLAR